MKRKILLIVAVSIMPILFLSVAREGGQGMRIGLYDADKTKYPNLPLMKISA